MQPAQTVRAAVAALPTSCYEKPTWKGLLYLARSIAMYAVALGALVATDHPLALTVLWPLAGLCISALFVLGHDAAHGALFRSQWLCALVGRIALLPGLHAYSAWVLGHNRIHHVHTNRRGIDFVWHPVTPEEYAALPRWARLRHRLEWSVWGAGAYYLRVVWWHRMMRFVPPPRFRRAFRRDRALICAYAAVMSATVVGLGFAHYGSATGAAWMWCKLCALPWMAWNYFIGATVYIHHVGPDVPWHTPQGWTRFKGQVEATTHFVASRWYNAFAQNIHLHVAHHVDPSIPFYNLPAAEDALQRAFAPALPSRPLRLRDYVQATRRCKLYDFARGKWCGYRAAASLKLQASSQMEGASIRGMA